jgi:hypothetical protein
MHARAQEPVRRRHENRPCRRHPRGRSIHQAVLAPTVDEEEGPPPPEIGDRVCGGAPAGIPAATLLGRARAAFSAGTSMGHVAEGTTAPAMAMADLEPLAPPASPPWEARPPRRQPRLCRPRRRPRACSRRIRHRASLSGAADLTSAGGGSRGGIWAPTEEAEEIPPLSHTIFQRKPNASHMCARIKFTHI